MNGRYFVSLSHDPQNIIEYFNINGFRDSAIQDTYYSLYNMDEDELHATILEVILNFYYNCVPKNEYDKVLGIDLEMFIGDIPTLRKCVKHIGDKHIIYYEKVDEITANEKLQDIITIMYTSKYIEVEEVLVPREDIVDVYVRIAPDKIQEAMNECSYWRDEEDVPVDIEHGDYLVFNS